MARLVNSFEHVKLLVQLTEIYHLEEKFLIVLNHVIFFNLDWNKQEQYKQPYGVGLYQRSIYINGYILKNLIPTKLLRKAQVL